MYFDKPYYLEPQKGGKKAYALLRDTLKETGKVGIARVVIKTRQHLAAVKPHEDALVLELMHFPQEVLAPKDLDLPHKEEVGKKEMDMAKALVQTMSDKWEPSKYHDEYREQMMELIQKKIESGGELPAAKTKAKAATNVVDLVAVLQQSLAASGTGGGKKEKKATKAKPAAHHKKKALKKAA
jgi:DNA end-binding protein Ku